MKAISVSTLNSQANTAIPSAQVMPFGQILCLPVPCAPYFAGLQPASYSWTGMPSGFPVHSVTVPSSADTQLPVTHPVGSVI